MDFSRGRAWWKLIARPALILGTLALVLTLALAACSDDDEESDDGTDAPELSGSINGDGSSTVFPIMEAVAEEFGKTNDVQVTVGVSGTGGGFEKFCAGETDFSNASRAIKDTEAETCAAGDIEYVEFEIGYDGLSVVVNESNTFATCLTVEQLNAIWKPDSSVATWADVDPSYPSDPLPGSSLYGPGTDSGTFDYFTAEINGEEGVSRSDYNASEDDNVLVQGVAGDDNAMGYFGFAYYEENTDKLNIVAVDGGDGCVEPSKDSIRDLSYSPLSRPLYVYVTVDALERPEVAGFMRFLLTDGVALVEEVGYVAAPDEVYEEGLAKLEGDSGATPTP
jgi:phosphate transport system substrate-binding protein